MNDCGCNSKKCGCNSKNYGVIRGMSESKCPHECVIPCVTVQNISGIKGLAACFVQVLDLNTTYYIDDQHRITKIWAGPVEYNNYNYAGNPLKLRSQEVWDFENSRIIRYDKAGRYLVFQADEIGEDNSGTVGEDNSGVEGE